MESRRISIGQGEYCVGDKPDTVISTLLGSCVATCLHDPRLEIGGMNHFLLPGEGPLSSNEKLLGVHLMELLINELMKKGADKKRLQAKLFGGACTVFSNRDIGKSNSDFARKFLSDEGIVLVGESLGGPLGRRIEYWPVTGRARQFMMRSPGTPSIYVSQNPSPSKKKTTGDVELF